MKAPMRRPQWDKEHDTAVLDTHSGAMSVAHRRAIERGVRQVVRTYPTLNRMLDQAVSGSHGWLYWLIQDVR